MKLILTLQDKLQNAATKMQISRLVNSKLSKYSENIRKITINVKDIHQDQATSMKQCNIELLLPGLPSMQIKAKGKDLLQATKRALQYSQQQLAHKYQLGH